MDDELVERVSEMHDAPTDVVGREFSAIASMIEQQTFTTSEACTIASAHANTVKRWTAQEGVGRKHGSIYLIPRADLVTKLKGQLGRQPRRIVTIDGVERDMVEWANWIGITPAYAYMLDNVGGLQERVRQEVDNGKSLA